MNLETIKAFVWIYEELPYYWQVIIFSGGIAAIALVVAVILSITSTIRILAEGLASLLSLGRLTFDETTEESKFKLPNLSGVLKKKDKPGLSTK